MKHLKTYKQLNELHSDTYYSAADKMGELGDSYSKKARMKKMGDYRKTQEEMGSEPEEEVRRNKRSLFRLLDTKYPEILSLMNISNWRKMTYGSLEDIVIDTTNSDLLEAVLKNTGISIPNEAVLNCISPNNIEEHKLDILAKYGALFNMSIVDRVLQMSYQGYSDSRRFGSSVKYLKDDIVLNILEKILPMCDDLVDNDLVWKIQNEKVYEIISKYIDIDLNAKNKDGNTVLVNNYINADVKAMWLKLGTDHRFKNVDGEGMEFTLDYEWSSILTEEFMDIADFNHKNNNGDTPVLKNIRSGMRYDDNSGKLTEIKMSTNYMLKGTTDPMIKDSDGKVAFQYLLKYKMVSYNGKIDDMFSALIYAGSEYEFDKKKPFIFHCIQYGLRDTFYYLYNNGYDMSQTYRGKTAYDYALSKSFHID